MENVLNGSIMMYFMVGILSIQGNLILFAIIIFTFFTLGYLPFLNNIVLCSLYYYCSKQQVANKEVTNVHHKENCFSSGIRFQILPCTVRLYICHC